MMLFLIILLAPLILLATMPARKAEEIAAAKAAAYRLAMRCLTP